MKIKRSILIITSMILLFAGISLVTAEDKPTAAKQPTPPPAGSVRQKITTPPLQLSEEEEKRVPAAGAADKGAQVPFNPTPIKTNSKVLLVVDASGSMNGIMGETTKMAVMKSVVTDIVTQPLPEGAVRELGLRAYGMKSESSKNDCKDTDLLIPVNPFDEKGFKEKLTSITAQGVTPIGYTLEAAEQDFTASPNTDNIIILVTDGADSCGANVCEIAKRLHEGPKKIMINVVGFDLSPEAQEAVKCIASASDGKFTTTRNENELMASLDSALMSNVPYNLRIKILSGATPLPSQIKVLRSGTDMVVREDASSGIKYYQLQPGTYDLEIVYTDSPERPVPSKVVRGVEVTASSKAEQTVQFDLGMLTLTSLDQTGKPIEGLYLLQKAEDPKVKVIVASKGATPTSVWLTAGTYSAKVSAKTPEGLKLEASVSGLKVDNGGQVSHEFQFQVGTLKLVGKDEKSGEPVSIRYSITPSAEDADKKVTKDKKEATAIEGSAMSDGASIDLPPGKYNIDVSLQIEGLKNLPAIELDDIEITAGTETQKDVPIPTGVISLSGKNSDGKPTETQFFIKMNGSTDTPAEFIFSADPVKLTLSPGRYDIKAVFTNSEFEPKPVINWEATPLIKGQLLEKVAEFKFGILKLVGKNSKNVPRSTNFYVHNSGSDEPLLTLNDITEPLDVRLTEGFYDIRAEDINAKSDPKPSVWFHNVEIKLAAPVSKEAIFTNGILKMICMGPNNVKIACDYKVYSYGSDSPIIEGVTDKNWREFDILPGNYYIEAGYHDEKDEVLLKKWITLKVSDNEMVEEIIRY